MTMPLGPEHQRPQVSQADSSSTAEHVNLASDRFAASARSAVHGQVGSDSDRQPPALVHSETNQQRFDRKRKLTSPSGISPPPLKRQGSSFSGKPGRLGSLPKMRHMRRVETFHGQVDNNEPISNQPPAPRSLSFPAPDKLRHAVSDARSIGNTSYGSRRSDTKAAAPSKRPTTRDDDDISISSNLTRSDVATGIHSKCVRCKKSAIKSFDLLVKCLTCKREFHDSCREPKLPRDADPKTWRCYVCVRKGRQPPLSAPASKGSTRDKHSSSFPGRKERLSTVSELGKPKITSLPFMSRAQAKANVEDEISLLEGLEDADLDKLVDELASVKPPEGSRQTSTPSISTGSAEIPNTPSQHSSQINTEKLPSAALPPDASQKSAFSLEHSSALESSSILEPSQSKAGFRATILCAFCKKQRILSSQGELGSMCHRCKNAKTGNVEKGTVPETPDAKKVSEMQQTTSTRKEKTIPASSDAEKPAFWFQGPRASIKKIVTKKVSREELPIVAQGSPEPVTSDSDHRTSPDDTLEGSDMEVSSAMTSIAGDFQMQQLIDSKAKTSKNRVSRDRESHTNKASDPDTSYLQSSTVSSLGRPSLVVKFIKQGDKYKSCDIVRGHEHKTTPKHVSLNNRAHYSFRELIALSLLATDKPCLTALEIQTWIATTYPDIYKVGVGPWARNVTAILSQSSHFRKESVEGERFFNWSFDTAATRRSYQQRFAKVSRPASPSLQRDFQLPATARPSLGRKISSGPTDTFSKESSRRLSRLHLVESAACDSDQRAFDNGIDIRNSDQALQALDAVRAMLRQGLTSETATSKAATQLGEVIGFWTSRERQEKPEAIAQIAPAAENQTPVYSPFEQEKQPFELQEGVTLVSKFEDAFPDYVHPLTDVEVKEKIEEIKKRPTRKAMFGKSLSHKRFGQKDVFDEKEKKTSKGEDGLMKGLDRDDGGLAAILRGLMAQAQEKRQEEGIIMHSELQFPENPTLMLHEGHLAFRDGTLINGRLPRPRAIYRVGRR